MNKAERVKLALAERDKARVAIYSKVIDYLNKRHKWYGRPVDCGPLGMMFLSWGGDRWEVKWVDRVEHWNGKALVKGVVGEPIIIDDPLKNW